MSIDINELWTVVVDKVEDWLTAAVALLPNLVMAILIVVGFGIASRWVRRLAEKGGKKIISSPQLVGLFASVLRIIVVATGAFIALSVLNLDKAVTSLLAGVGIVGLALGFAFQDIAANFVSGVLMAVRRPFQLKDLVQVGDFFGRVEAIDLRSTRVTLLSGETVIVPNKDVYQNAIVNYTETTARRVEVEVGVSYADDLRNAAKLATDAVTSIECRDSERDVELFFTEFGGSSINFVLRFWLTTAEQVDYLLARSESIIAIKEAFDDGGITIPFPIRTLDFGIAGGEQLREHLELASNNDNDKTAKAS